MSEAPPLPPLANCRVILVRPEIAGNIGATARAMQNFGLRHLVLVEPKADPADPEARRRSTHGEAILKEAQVVADIGAAVADCMFVAGTSARIGGLLRDQSVAPPESIMSRLIAALATGPAAMVFGPEPSGLTNEEVARCHYLIHIPSDPEYPALNLSHAVTVCLYELRRHWLGVRCTDTPQRPANFADQEEAFDHLRRGLEAIHFLYGDKADSLMHAVRHLIGRASPSEMELGVLHGLARQLEWIAARANQPG
jgi:tRNA/rRNA methyltransferase